MTASSFLKRLFCHFTTGKSEKKEEEINVPGLFHEYTYTAF